MDRYKLMYEKVKVKNSKLKYFDNKHKYKFTSKLGIFISVIGIIATFTYNIAVQKYEHFSSYIKKFFSEVPVTEKVFKFEEVVNPIDFLLIIILVVLIAYIYRIYKLEQLYHIIDDQNDEIGYYEKQLEGLGGSLLHHVSTVLSLSTESILKEICKLIVDNNNIIMAASAFSYIESQNRECVTFVVDNLAHYTLHDVRANVIAKEIYQYDLKEYQKYRKILIDFKNVQDLLVKDLYNYVRDVHNMDEIPQSMVSELLEYKADEVVSDKTRNAQYKLLEEILRFTDELMGSIKNADKINKNPLLKHKLVFDPSKIGKFLMKKGRISPGKRSDDEAYRHLSSRDATRMAMLNALLSMANDEIGGSGLDIALEKKLRRIQRTGIMTTVLREDAYYCGHIGNGEKNGRMYFFQPVVLDQQQIVLCFSIESKVLSEKDDTIIEQLRLMSDKIVTSVDTVCKKYGINFDSY